MSDQDGAPCNLNLRTAGQLAHPPQGISEHTNQEYQGLNHPASKRPLQKRLNRPLWICLADV